MRFVLHAVAWAALLTTRAYGEVLFKVLDALSKRLCFEGPSPLGCEASDLQYEGLEGQLSAAQALAPNATGPGPPCSLEGVMAQLALATRLRARGHPRWAEPVARAQAVARCVGADGDLSALVLTGRRPFEALLRLGAGVPPPRRPHGTPRLWERLRSPVERVEAQWCGANPRASGRVADMIAVHALGAAVHRTPAGRRVLEVAVFFEREYPPARGEGESCGTFLASHWYRPRCHVGDAVAEASVLSGLMWSQPIKSNLFACVLPEEVRERMVVTLDEEDWEEPLRIELCLLPADLPPPSGAAVCTEPLHSLHGSRAVVDLVEHHLDLGFAVDLYDSDGSAEAAFDRFRATGRVAYFPRFVAAQYGERLGRAERSELDEPAAGCSAGMQEIHCLFRHRGRSRWVAPRLDPDEFFFAPWRANGSAAVAAMRDFEV